MRSLNLVCENDA